LQAPRELVPVQVQLAGWELADLAAMIVGHGRCSSVPLTRRIWRSWYLVEIAVGVMHG
jgi:hypothetical protein